MIELDLLDPDLHAAGGALDALDRAREAGPIAWTRGRRGRGYWSVTGLRELVAVARDPAAFTSHAGTRPEVVRPEGVRRPLHNLDPPDHGALRRIAELALEPLPSGRLPMRAFAKRGGDVVRDLAEPLGASLFGEWLRVDGAELLARVTSVHEAGAALLDAARDDEARPALAARARNATEAMASFFERALRDATTGPLARLRREARDPEEALWLAALFAEAGLPTLVDAIGSVVFDVATHAGDLAPRPSLVSELLRRASPIVQFARRATRDVTLEGVNIAKGDQLVLWFLAANHDPRAFANPRSLVADRAPNPHVAFGFGLHRCVGARLAHATLAELVSECRELGLAEPPVRKRSNYQRGFARLVVTPRA